MGPKFGRPRRSRGPLGPPTMPPGAVLGRPGAVLGPAGGPQCLTRGVQKGSDAQGQKHEQPGPPPGAPKPGVKSRCAALWRPLGCSGRAHKPQKWGGIAAKRAHRDTGHSQEELIIVSDDKSLTEPAACHREQAQGPQHKSASNMRPTHTRRGASLRCSRRT